MAELKGNRLTGPDSRWKRKFEETQKVRNGWGAVRSASHRDLHVRDGRLFPRIVILLDDRSRDLDGIISITRTEYEQEGCQKNGAACDDRDPKPNFPDAADRLHFIVILSKGHGTRAGRQRPIASFNSRTSASIIEIRVRERGYQKCFSS